MVLPQYFAEAIADKSARKDLADKTVGVLYISRVNAI